MTRWALGIGLLLLLAATAAFPPQVGSQTNGQADPSVQRFVPKILAYSEKTGKQGSGVYLNGGIRTARHVVADLPAIMVNGEPASLTCADEPTDSATLAGPVGPVMEEDRTGLLMGEVVLIAGWPRGTYREIEARVLAWAPYILLETGRMVGPVYILAWTGPRLDGISGGPVIRRGKVVATMVAQGTTALLSVPVAGAKCQMSAS